MSSLVLGTTLRPEHLPLADLAGALARRAGVDLRLVHVSEDPRAPFVLGTDEEGILGPVRATLAAEARRLTELTGAKVHVHLAAGDVVDALVSVAGFEVATALLVGGELSKGRTVLGATAERVSRKSAVPVLTLRDLGRLRAWVEGERALRVLVGADLGRAAEGARAFAARLAAVGPVAVDVVMVVSPPEVHARLGLAPPAHEHALSPQAEAMLLRDLARAAPATEADARVRVLVARGSADAHLTALADQEGHDLVVVGQRRSSILEQLWYGSVARGVLRGAPVSVACVPPTASSVTAAPRVPRVVLVATDMTEVGDRAVAHGAGVVAPGGVIHVAHVLTDVSGSSADARQAREQAWYALGRISTPEAGDRATAIERHVLEGDAADQILALADRVGADLVVVGARSRSGVARALLGSVARAVGERSRVPILLVPMTPT